MMPVSHKEPNPLPGIVGQSDTSLEGGAAHPPASAPPSSFPASQAVRVYRPSNGTEGHGFEARFCSRCEREAAWRDDPDEDACAIHLRALAFGITDPTYPHEWQHGPNGPTCTAFVPEGQPLPEQVAHDRARYEAAMAEMRAAQESGR